jgi:hypothetical protein
MSDELLNAIIAAIPPILAVIVAWLNLSRKLNRVHVDLNGRLGQLLESTRSEANLQGRQDERDKQGA